MAKNKLTKKFRNAALSTVCVFALLSNTAAQAFSAQDFFAAASNGDVAQITSFVNESRLSMQKYDGNMVLNLNLRDANGDTAIMKAAAAGHVDVIDYLVRNGASLSVTNNAGQTAYNIAMKNNQLGVAEYILMASQPSQQLNQNAQYRTYPPLTQPEAPESAYAGTNESTYMVPLIGTAIGLAVGGVALAAGGGGGSSSGSGTVAPTTGATIQSGIIDTGGTAGAGNTHPASGNPATYLTTEATNQQGYQAMGTQYAAARGYDGSLYVRNADGTLVNNTADSRIVVAVLDTGVDLTHPDLSANILVSKGVNCTVGAGCVTGTGAGNDTDGHGTFVAGIIAAEKNGVGMQGIAPQAEILPVAFLNEYDNTNPQSPVYIGSDISAIQYAVDQKANIFNASYALQDGSSHEIPIITPTTQGTGTTAYSPTDLRTLLTQTENGSNYVTVFQNMVAAHQIIVWAAGNDSMSQVATLGGLPYYFQGVNPGSITGYSTVNPSGLDWSKNWVTVVSLQNNLTALSTFSNQCGVAMNWCLAAPGEISMSTALGGTYASGSGTSFAAPNVSGALAVLMGAFPHLTPEQALKILFDTATDLGAPGVDPVFGHGLVNLQKATDPTAGGWNIATGPTAYGSLTPLALSTFRLTAPFGDGLAALGSQKTMFLDAYTKNYLIPVSALISSKAVAIDKLDVMNKFGEGNLPEVTNTGSVKIGFSAFTSSEKGSGAYTGQNEAPVGKMLVSTDMPIMGSLVNASFTNNISVADTETMHGKTSLTENSLYGGFKNQYLNLSDKAQNVSFGVGDEALSARVGYFHTTAATESDAVNFDRANDVESMGIYSSINYKPSDESTLYVQSGMNVESGSFLGANASGAFSLGSETKTYFSSFSFEHSLTDNLTFLGNYSLGITELGIGQNSLITNVSNAISDSFAVGLEYNEVLDHDKVGVSFSQPLRVRSASADLMLPYDVAVDGSIMYNSFQSSIAPVGRELDLQGYYARDISDDSKVLFGSVLRSEPDNIKDAPTEALFVAKYSTKF